MALVLAFKVESDFRGLNRDVAETRQSVASLTADARKAAEEARVLALGLEQVSAAAGQMTPLQQAAAAAIQDTATMSREQLDALRAAHDPLFAAQQAYIEKLAEIAAAAQAAGLPQAEMEAALQRAQVEFQGLVTEIERAEQALKDGAGAASEFGGNLRNEFSRGMDQGLRRLGPLGAGLRALGPAGIAAGAGIALMVAALVPATMRLAETERLVLRVEAVLKATGGAAGHTAQEIEWMAQRMQRATGTSRDEILSAAAALATFTSIGGREYEQALLVAEEMSRVFGGDLRQNLDSVARAMDDPIEGFAMLQRRGFALRMEEAELAAQMMRTGDVAGAQRVVLKNLQDQVGGAAAAEATGLAGSYVRAKNATAGFLEELARTTGLGYPAARALDAVTGALERYNEAAERGRSPEARLDRSLEELARIDRADRLVAEGRMREVPRDLINPAARAARREEIENQIAGGIDALDRAAQTQEERAAKAQHVTDLINKQAKEFAEAIKGFETPAERLKRFRNELETSRTEIKANLEFGADPEAVQKALAQAEELYRRRVEQEGESARSAAEALALRNAQLSLGTRLTLDAADAWLTGADAGMRAEAGIAAMTEALQTGADAQEAMRLALGERVAAEALTGAQSVAHYQAEAAALGRLNDQVAAGSLTVHEAQQLAEREAQLRPLLIARANAEGDAKELLTRIIDELTAAMGRYNAEAARSAALAIQDGQAREIEMLEARRQALSMGIAEGERYLAMKAEEQRLLALSPHLREAEVRVILENTDAIVAQAQAVAREGEARALAMRTTENALNRVADQIASGKMDWQSWGDVAVSVLQDVMRELTRLSLSAPMMNMLFGTNHATIADVGGILGSIFHDGGIIGMGGKPQRLVPPHLVASAPRFHTGGRIGGGPLGSNERVIIAELDEEMLTADDPRHIRNIRRMARNDNSAGGDGGGDAAAPRITIINHPAPNTRVESKTRRGPGGETIVENFVREIKEGIASDIAGGQGPITGAIAGRFGLNPSVGTQR